MSIFRFTKSLSLSYGVRQPGKIIINTMVVVVVVVDLSPEVSGKLAAARPAREANIPMVRTGAGCQYTFSRSSSIVVIPPSLAMRAHRPTDWFLVQVGKSSAV